APRVRRRSTPLAIEHPLHVVHRIDVELPIAFDIQPVDDTIDRDGIRYRGTVTQTGLLVAMRYALETTVSDVDVASVERYLETLAKVDRAMDYAFTNESPRPGRRAETPPAWASAWWVAPVAVAIVLGAVMLLIRRTLPISPARAARGEHA